MAKSLIAPVKPELLKWARETAGYQLEGAAKRLGVNVEKLAAVEAGDDSLSFSQLKKAADTYKRPLAAMFLDVAPLRTPESHDFRLHPDATHRAFSPRLNFEIREARQHRADAMELARELDERVSPLDHRADIGEPPEVVADRVRRLLGVDHKTQSSWKD
jgi:transcriptional regulator with XRE-family HTH domain